MYDEIIGTLSEAYDNSAVDRDQNVRERWKVEERAAFLGLLQREGKKALLEIGAGPGRDSLFFQQNGLQVVATDLAPEMVQLCLAKGLEAYVSDFKSLDFEAQRFDGAYALNCLLHVPKQDLPEVLQVIEQLLKPGGLFFVAVYGGQESEGLWEEDQHRPKRFFSFFTDEGLSKAVGSVFEICDFKVISPPTVSEGLHIQRLILRKT